MVGGFIDPPLTLSLLLLLQNGKTAVDLIICEEKTPERAEIVKRLYEAAKAQAQSEADRQKLTPQHLGAFVKGSEWDKWASTLNASLGRYVLKGKGPKYDTDTCQVFKAVDVLMNNQKVCSTPLL